MCHISDLDFPAAARKVPFLTGAESQATKHLIIIDMLWMMLLIDANILPKGRVHKSKSGKSLVFCQTGGRGGVSEGSKMPNLYFGVLKRVKNGLKMAKKHIEILYLSNLSKRTSALVYDVFPLMSWLQSCLLSLLL